MQTSTNAPIQGRDRVGLGGSCHWCTEAIFQSLRGVEQVQQGWLSAHDAPATFSEGVLVSFFPDEISLADLIAVHLYTHSCTSNHSMRGKYRSAIYTFSQAQALLASSAITALQVDFEQKIITEVCQYEAFKENTAEYQNYFLQNPERPFCQNYIHPKLRLLRHKFAQLVKQDTLAL